MSIREHVRLTRNRREFMTDAFCGFGSLALAGLVASEGLRAAGVSSPGNPLAPKAPPIAAKAKSVIFLFMAGGPSHLDTFDPKPLLNRLDGQKRPAEFGEAKYQFVQANATLLGSKRTFQKYGQSGIDVSDLLPHTAQCVDDMAVVRSVHGDMVVHSAAQYQLFTGRILPGFPSMGSWMLYGLGTESESLPGYVVMPDPKGALEGGQPMYGTGFLPAIYQPTMFRPGAKPVLNLDLPAGVTREARVKTLKLIQGLDRADMRAGDQELEARLSAYDLAFRMQTEAPETFDLSKESPKTLEMYGIGDPKTDDYGRRLLLTRRLVEKGVRFVCPVSGGGPGNMQWDAHDDIEENHIRMAAQTDKPVAALLKDLKQRAGCWIRRWWCGAGSLGARRNRRGVRGGTITIWGSRCGWQAGVLRAVRWWGRRTISG